MPAIQPPPTVVSAHARRPRLATVLSARGAYVAIILFATLSNLHPHFHDGRVHERLVRAFVPRVAWSDSVDALRNILLFAGFGAVWEVTSPAGRLRDALWRATLYGGLISVGVETLQLFSPTRFASILDVATNTAGSFLGAFGLAVIVAAVRVRRDERSYLGLPAFLLAAGQLGAVVMEAATPLFRQDLLHAVSGGPLTRLRRTLATAAPLSIHGIPRSELGLALPAGFLAVGALVELGMSRAAAAVFVAAGGTVLVLLSEIGHGATGELIVWGAVLAHAIGLIAGAVIAALWLPALARRFRGVDRVRVFVAAYVAVLVGWLWRPFRPRLSLSAIADQLAPLHWLPMAALARQDDVFTVGHVIQLFFLMLPAGALLGAWPARDRGAMRWVLPAVWLAAVLEVGHVFIASREFDVTNFLIMVAGAWMGWWIVRRAGVPVRGTWLPERS